MATKTFDELKQMAIQIRDEKTNKQNTATRIGTQMIEHLNKLEQEYYNKENIDEQNKQTDVKFSELNNRIDTNMPYVLLPFLGGDDMIQIDYPAKKLKFRAAYFLTKNAQPYSPIYSSTSIVEYETDFMTPDSGYGESQVWLLAFKVEDRKLYYINYASIPAQTDSEGNIEWYPLAYCNFVSGEFHTNFQGTLYYNGRRYTNTKEEKGNLGGWVIMCQDGNIEMLSDNRTVRLPSRIAMFNAIKNIVIQIYFDKDADSPTWENTYAIRHYLKNERDIELAISPDVIAGLYFREYSSYNDDYKISPFIARQYDNNSWTSILPERSGYGNYTLVGLFRYGRFTTSINVITYIAPEQKEPFSVSFYGSDPKSTINIDTINKKVTCREGNNMYLTNISGSHNSIFFSESNNNLETDILLYSAESTVFSKETLWYLYYTADDKRVYLVNYNRLSEFFGKASTHTRDNSYLLGAGTFTTDGNTFVTRMPFTLNGVQYYSTNQKIDFPDLSSLLNNNLFGNSNLGNLQYEEIGEADYNQIILYGQSLSMGWEAPEVITKEAIEGNFMVGTLPIIYNPNMTPSDFNPLIAVKWSAGGEQPIVGCTNAFSKLYRRFVNKNQLFIGSNVGEGGRSIEKLSKDCTNGENYYTTRFLKLLDSTKSIAEGKGKTVNCSAILYMQGEYNYVNLTGAGLTPGTDATNDKDTYKALLLKLKNDMQADIMEKYGQKNKPLFFIYEVAGSYINNKEMSINMAQIEFAQENDDVFLLHPTYSTPDYGGGHLSTNGYRWYGEMMAKSLYNVFIKGEDYKPVFPMEYKVSENKLIIDFYVPVPPLVFDTWTKETVTNMGFRVYNNGSEVTISNVEIAGNSVVITCTSNLSGTVEVTYAGQGRSGSGNLRDSDTFHSYYTYFDDRETSPSKRENYTPEDKEGNLIYGKPYPMYNWCANFYHKVE